MESVLVTGGNGFIGGHVVDELLARGYRVSVLDTRWRTTIPGAALVLGDIRDATAVTEAVAHVDGVIHLAGVLGTQETIANPRPAAETNILGGLNVFEACVQYDVPLTNIAVGNYWMNNTYSITKHTVERFAEMLNKYRKARIATVRALNAYGPRQAAATPYGPSKVRKIMPSFVCRALSGLDIEVYGDGTQIMDMVYVTDVARVLVTTLEHTAKHGAPEVTPEAGTGRRTTVNDIAETVIKAVGSFTGANHVTLKHLPMRPGEDERSVVIADPTTLRAIDIDSGDFVTLEEGVEKSVRYFSDYLLTR